MIHQTAQDAVVMDLRSNGTSYGLRNSEMESPKKSFASLDDRNALTVIKRSTLNEQSSSVLTQRNGNGHVFGKEELFECAHIRTIYNICLAAMTVLLLHLFANDIAAGGSISLKLDLLYWFFGKPLLVIKTCFLMFLSMVLCFYPSYYTWAHIKISNGMVDMFAGFVYIIWVGTFIVLPVRYILKENLPIGSSAIVVCEQVRLLMKAHSFLRENCRKSLEYKHGCNDNEKSVHNPSPSFDQFMYFLLVPTLIYRDQYPRNSRIAWRYVGRCFLEVGLCLFYSYYLFIHFYVPQLQNFNRKHVSWRCFMLFSFRCILPASLNFVLLFYAVLHAWMNAFAELLRFADRQFYRDWWNSTSMSSYYRNWNCIVHDWLYAYIYKDCCAVFGDHYRAISMIVVFFVSAVVHEYIISVAMRFFFPLLFIQFFVLAGPTGIMLLMRSTYDKSWNFLLWIMIMIGNGILLCGYGCEWYARRNCPTNINHITDYIIPRSWTCDTDVTEVGSICNT